MRGTVFEIKTTRAKLIDRVRVNRERHAAAVAKALTDFRTRYCEKLAKLLAEGQSDAPTEQLALHLGLPRPESHLDDYDRIIGMLEMSASDAQIELTEDQYRQYAEDKWSWTESFEATSSLYR